MLESHINRIIEYCDKIISLKEFYYHEDLSQIEDLPNFLSLYLNSFINQKVESDLNKIKDLSYYDFSTTKSIELLTEFSTLLKERIFLSQEQLKLIIIDLIHLHFNFLIRPKNTLLISFEKNSDLQIGLIIEKYQIFNEYKYLTNGIFHKLDDFLNKSNDISYKELESLIEQIDSEHIFGKSAKEFITLVEPIYSLFDINDKETNEQIVPTEALMIFFDDKSLLPIVELLESKFHNENLKFVSKKQLLEILVEILDSIENETDMFQSDDLDFDINIVNMANYDNLDNIDKFENIEIIEDVENNILTENLNTNYELKTELTADLVIDSNFEAKSDLNVEDELLKDVDIDSSKLDANDLSAYGFDLSDFEDEEDFVGEVTKEDIYIDEDANANVNANADLNVLEDREEDIIYTKDIDFNSKELDELSDVLNSFNNEFKFNDDDNSIDLNELDELLK